MTTAVVMPDATALALDVLNASSAVTALAGDRIGLKSPEDTTQGPWLRVHRIGGPTSADAWMRHGIAYMQVDAFAPAATIELPSDVVRGDAAAADLARAAEAAFFAAVGFSNEEGIITAVSETLGLQQTADSSRQPPTPRVLFTVALTIATNPS